MSLREKGLVSQVIQEFFGSARKEWVLTDRDKVEGSTNPRAKFEKATQEIDPGLNLSLNSPITFLL